MEQLPAINLRKGATSIVEIDLTDFDIQGGSVLLVMRERGGEVVREWEFDAPGVHEIIFEDEFTASLETGAHRYEYDVMWHFGGERFAQCAPSPIEVHRTVGGYPHGADD